MDLKRWLPLLILLCLMGVAYQVGGANWASFESLKNHRHTLLKWMGQYPYTAPFVYVGSYAVLIALSIPGGAIFSVAGGFLFPQPLATFLVVIGATMGATTLFLIASTALGNRWKKGSHPLVQKMQKGFHRNPASYLLFLRLIPLFPFWLVNVTPAFFHVRLGTYVVTTFFGIIPGAFVFTQAGAGLGAVFDKGDTLSVTSIFNTQVKIALIALALFALLPVFVKRWWNQ